MAGFQASDHIQRPRERGGQEGLSCRGPSRRLRPQDSRVAGLFQMEGPRGAGAAWQL